MLCSVAPMRDPRAPSSDARLRAAYATIVMVSYLFASGTGLAAEQADFRCPIPGTVIEFAPNGRIVFTGQDGMWCLGTNTRGQQWRYYAMLANAGSAYIENHVERIWPLEIGKEITFKIQGGSNNVSGGESYPIFWYTERIVVARQERVSVQAGTFDTWAIEIHEDTSGQGRTFSAVRTYWYAPNIGYNVKMTYHIAMGVGKDDAWEAKAITTAGAGVATPSASSEPNNLPTTPAARTPPSGSASPSAPPSISSGTSNSASSAERLRTLKDLLDRKLITKEEYDERRKAILDSISGPVR